MSRSARKAISILMFGVCLLVGCKKESKTTPPVPFVVHLHTPPLETGFQVSVDQGTIQSLPDDAFGAQWAVSAEAATLIIKRDGDELDRLSFTQNGPGVWFFAGSPAALYTPPPVLPSGSDELVIYFVPSADAPVKAWGLHLWDAVTNQGLTDWSKPQPLTDTVSPYGLVTKVKTASAKLGVIVHDGDLKAVDQDIYYEPARSGRMIFLGMGSEKIYCSPTLKPCGWQAEREGGSAHWVKRDEILWKVDDKAARYLLLSSADGRLDFDQLKKNLQDPTVLSLPLTKNAAPSAEALEKFPHLARFTSFRVSTDPSRVTSELMLVALNEQGRILASTRPQLGGVLDDVYAYSGTLGLTLAPNRLKVWAPTAQTVKFKLYDAQKKLIDTLPMQEEAGVWALDIAADWIAQRLYYRFEVKVFHPFTGHIEQYEVSDPYALSGSQNGTYSQLLNVNDPNLKPVGWDNSTLPVIKNPTDMVFYELHIRDFSARDASVPKDLRGTYNAFTVKNSKGMQHLQGLAEAGLTHVQVLPAYDFGSVNEDATQTINIDDPFAKLCALITGCQNPADTTIFEAFDRLPRDGQDIAQWNAVLADRDSFNWGYDPVHYGMPDGSYVSRDGGEGAARVLQFRSMAKGLADIGLHLAMDVVYNHTYAAGLNADSVLDKIVPGYYHRLNPISGAIERSSCCENTASERVMMEKLMIDTLKRWHDVYRVDAFRFDLMGLHMKSNMLNIQTILGPDVFLFGEGWAMGEVNSDIRNEFTARQQNMAGTGIGTFNDRFRDAVRGGGPLDSGTQLYQQSPVNGLFFDDNGRSSSSVEAKKNALLGLQDKLRLGLAGTLRDYAFISSTGEKISGQKIDGYTQEPRESINYIENHDNQTYWDINQLKLPYALAMEERVRVHTLGLTLNMLAAGVPYFEMGAEFLRSKSLIRDSYNAGDWFNQVDFDFMRSNWNRGLPPADKDGNNLDVIRETIKNVPAGPDGNSMSNTVAIFRDLLSIRKDSPLFRLTSAQDVQKRIDFLPGTEGLPGVIALRIHDEKESGIDLDPRYSEIVVVFNLQGDALQLDYAKTLELHPLQKTGHDERVKQASSDGLHLQVPGRTAAIYVARQVN